MYYSIQKDGIPYFKNKPIKIKSLIGSIENLSCENVHTVTV